MIRREPAGTGPSGPAGTRPPSRPKPDRTIEFPDPDPDEPKDTPQ